MALIELAKITKIYGSGADAAVVNVDLTIDPGESVAIVGESGAGKTTLARILLRLVEPTSGRYIFDGMDVFALDRNRLREWRRNVQTVFQDPISSLSPRLRVNTLVTEPLEALTRLNRTERTREAARLLELVGLPSLLARRYPHQLSGGQQQRVALARALSTQPQLLVLDEPASALDVSVRAQILNLLNSIREQHRLTYVYITHDLATVGYLCDRICVLYSGQIVEDIASGELLSAAQHPYTQALVDAASGADDGLSTRISPRSFAAGIRGDE